MLFLSCKLWRLFYLLSACESSEPTSKRLEKHLELLTGFSLLFDRLHGLHDLLLLDAKLLLFFCFTIFATEIAIVSSIVPRLRLLEDLVE